MRTSISIALALLVASCGSSLKAGTDAGDDMMEDVLDDGQDVLEDTGHDAVEDSVTDPEPEVEPDADDPVPDPVDTVEVTDPVEEEPACDPTAWFTFASTDTPRAIPDDTELGITSSVTVTGCPIDVGDIEVDVDIRHGYRGDLTVILMTPTHEQVLLHDGSGGSEDNLHTTYPTLTAPAQTMCMLLPTGGPGTWSLKVVDDMPGDSGTLQSWTLRLRERADHCPESWYEPTGTFPIAIPDDTPMGIESDVVVPDHGSISSIAVLVDISHEYMGDVFIWIESPGGENATLYDRSGSYSDDLLTIFPIETAPVDSLSVYTGDEMHGTWTLHVADLDAAFEGHLDGWRLSIE